MPCQQGFTSSQDPVTTTLDPATLATIPRSYSPERLQQLNEEGIVTASINYGSTLLNKRKHAAAEIGVDTLQG